MRSDHQPLSCNNLHWELSLFNLLKDAEEVVLTDLDYATDGAFCEGLARRFSMEMHLDAPKNKTAHFRKLAKPEVFVRQTPLKDLKPRKEVKGGYTQCNLNCN